MAAESDRELFEYTDPNGKKHVVEILPRSYGGDQFNMPGIVDVKDVETGEVFERVKRTDLRRLD